MQTEALIRNYGILPGDQPLPTGKVRSFIGTGQTIGQWIGTMILAGGPALIGCGLIAGGALAHVELTTRIGLITFGIFLLAAAVLIFSMVLKDYKWVELDGEIIRAKSLYTGRVVEKKVQDINDILTETLAIKTIAARMHERKHGRIRAFNIRFHDLPKGIKLVRPEMKNVGELIGSLIATMARMGTLAPEIVDLEGTPIIRRVTWAHKIEQAKAAMAAGSALPKSTAVR